MIKIINVSTISRMNVPAGKIFQEELSPPPKKNMKNRKLN